MFELMWFFVRHVYNGIPFLSGVRGESFFFFMAFAAWAIVMRRVANKGPKGTAGRCWKRVCPKLTRDLRATLSSFVDGIYSKAFSMHPLHVGPIFSLGYLCEGLVCVWGSECILRNFLRLFRL